MGCRKLDISPLEKAPLQLVYSAGSWPEKTGVSYSYFGARYYDPNISIWLSVDPMADQRSWVSPYSYCQNNPIGRVDPTGALDDEWELFINKDGVVNVIWMSDKGGKDVQIINFSKANEQGDHIKAFDPIALSSTMSENDVDNTLASLGNKIGVGLGAAALSGDRLLDFSKGVFNALQAESNALNLGLDYGSELGKLGKLGSVTRWAGTTGGFLSILSSGYEFSRAQTLESKVEHGFDAFMGGVGLFGGPVGAGASIYWGTVGKPLHNKWRKEVLMPQIKMGIEGYPSIMPMK